MLHASLIGLITAAERRSSDLALLVLGLDGFQQINDICGHAAGDLVLRAVAEPLTTEVGAGAIVARLSGDEYAVARDCADASEPIAEFAERLVRAFETPLATGRQHRVKISIGVAIYPDGGRNADDLLSNGHLALTKAKLTRRGSHVIFESAIRQELEKRLKLESELALAADRGEFQLSQPQVRLVDGSLIAAEALIRWRHPVRGYVSPAEFMPVVNTSALSERIANCVMETACPQARDWELSGKAVRVVITLSPSQLHSGDLAHSFAALLEARGSRRRCSSWRSPKTSCSMTKAACSTCSNDPGAGRPRSVRRFRYRLCKPERKKFPLDGLKIDRSFVVDLLADSDDAAIVSSTIGLSKQVGLTVVAEGIENRATADFLVSMGCEEGQGYFFVVRCRWKRSIGSSWRLSAPPSLRPDGPASI